MAILDKVKPLTEKQKQVLAALGSKDVDLVGVFGPSGSGKSLLTCSYGIDSLEKGEYRCFVIMRPLADVLGGKGYSAADLGETYFSLASAYLFDLLTPYVEREVLEGYLKEGKVVLADPTFLRGRTFDNSLILLDDSQNAAPDVIVESLIRLGKDSKLVIAGDPLLQVAGGVNGAVLARELLLGEERAIVIDLGYKDIVRPGAKRGFKLALEMRLRKRELSEEERKVRDLAQVHAPDADIVTVVDLRDLKSKYGVTNVPDMLIVSKEGYLGRLIGKGGERINKIEKDSGLALRAVELTMDFRNMIRALHPLGWIGKHLVDAELVGPALEVTVSSREFGAFMGQRGAFIRFISEAFGRMMGISVRARPVEVEREKKKRKK